MAQFTIYGLRSHLDPQLDAVSDAVHAVAIEAFALPAEKRFHRFVLLEEREFRYPAGRSNQYTIVELSMFEGRSVETKKLFYRRLFETFDSRLGIQPNDLEVTITETPRHNWAIRGVPGDELQLGYRVDV